MAANEDGTMVQDPPVAAPEPVAPVATPPVDAGTIISPDKYASLEHKLNLVVEDNKRKGEINDRLSKQLDQLRAEKRKEHEAKGNWQPLIEEKDQIINEQKQRIAELESQLQQRDQADEQRKVAERFRSLAAQRNAHAPEDLVALAQSKGSLRVRSDGALIVEMADGTVKAADSLLDSWMAPSSPHSYLFAAAQRPGMGASGSQIPEGMQNVENPWASGNLTQQLLMLRDNPEMAKSLQALAEQSAQTAG